MSAASPDLPVETDRHREGQRWSIAGLVAVALVVAAACAVEWLQRIAFGESFLEALVAAILLGAVARTCWQPSTAAERGIACLAKLPLECAIVLMGLALGKSAAQIVHPAVLAAVLGFVVVAVGCGWLIGRALGLSPRMAALIACGNAICGNSAIAAVAPAIRASDEEVTAAIAFTALVSIIVVFLFPIVALALHMAPEKAGALAGLVIYAVPQVIAAAAPLGSVAVQTGTIVKLLRVLMLAPTCILLSIAFSRAGGVRPASLRQALVLPWFIIGFVVTAFVQHALNLPASVLVPASRLAGFLTLVSMAALGLSVDLSRLLSLSGRAVIAVGGSLIVVIGAGAALVWLQLV